jgi:hypothetical protein
MSQLPEVQNAIRALDGVSGAFVRWPDPDGPATLHVRFADGVDKATVSDQIAAILSDVGGVDLQTLEQEPSADAPAAPPDVPDPLPDAAVQDGGQAPADSAAAAAPDAPAAATAARGRPAFAGILVDQQQLDTVINVTLRHAGRTVTGSAEGLASSQTVAKTAAAATIKALRELLPADVRIELDWLRVADVEERGVVQSAVTMLSRTGEELFVGSALVRGDVQEAAVRATLCALNRRLERI